MERWSDWHCVNDEFSVVGKVENDDFQQLRVVRRTDDEDLRRVGIGFEVDHDDRMLDCVDDVVLSDAVTSSRSVKLHSLSVLR